MRGWAWILLLLLLLSGCAKPAPSSVAGPADDDAKWSVFPHTNVTGPSTVRWHLVRAADAPYRAGVALLHVTAPLNATTNGQSILLVPVAAPSAWTACSVLPPDLLVPRRGGDTSLEVSPGWYYAVALPGPTTMLARMQLYFRLGSPGPSLDVTNETISWVTAGHSAKRSAPQTGPSTFSADASPAPHSPWLALGSDEVRNARLVPGQNFEGRGSSLDYRLTVSFNDQCAPVTERKVWEPGTSPLLLAVLQVRASTSAVGPAGPVQVSGVFAPANDQSPPVEHQIGVTWVSFGTPTVNR